MGLFSRSRKHLIEPRLRGAEWKDKELEREKAARLKKEDDEASKAAMHDSRNDVSKC